MKKIIILSILILLTMTSYSKDENDDFKYFNYNSVEIESIASNIDIENNINAGIDSDIDNKKNNDVNLNFKLSFKTYLNKNIYGKVDIFKHTDSDIEYGYSVGIEESFKYLITYSEINYYYENKKINYDTGVKINYYQKFIPYFESDDYVDNYRWIAKVGFLYLINSTIYIHSEYSFPIKEEGMSIGVGVGVNL